MSDQINLYVIFWWRRRYFVGCCVANRNAKPHVTSPEWLGECSTLEDARFIVQVQSTGVLPKHLLWHEERKGREGMIEVWGDQGRLEVHQEYEMTIPRIRRND